MRKLLPLFGALLCGALGVLAFSPFDFWPLALVSLAGLFAVTHHCAPGPAAARGFAWSLGLYLPGLWWIHNSMTIFGGLPLPVAFVLVALLAAYLSLYTSLALWLAHRFVASPRARLLWVLPVLLIGADWLRGWMLTGFPWLWFGYSQLDGPLAGLAPILGVQGISWLLLFSAAALWRLGNGLRWRAAAFAVVLWGLGVASQQLQWVSPTQTLRVALVQGNIEQSLKWIPGQLEHSLKRYLDLTRPALHADLVIWPESALPASEQQLAPWLEQVDKLMAERNQSLITGLVSRPAAGEVYNAVLGLGNGRYQPGQGNRYYKQQLVPIGEFVPLGDLLRPLAPFFNLPMSSFSRGESGQADIHAAGRDLSVAICYEVAFPGLVRANMKPTTDFLLTVSNDTWFGRSIGPWQHQQIARMRALELGRPMIRATNNGVTLVTDEKGRMSASLPQFEQGVLTAEVTGMTGLTPYARFGNLPLLAVLGLSLLIASRCRQPAGRLMMAERRLFK
ncbi:apolipoprotein N-acyltransferase [Oceanimonas doudoroffii]|uniref:Apolipoprotein N-acyltransferase n=1 Tax=Oceanimonas doudoroffii TaxID=84158 RepID=A0A233REA2_9GAMM|nr:apolipoprotein N-acyltransferase [Oceanimonas doudoroffii]OXY81721.1 apolipoprotein N-acyltransferase [Oceanimonas doudoroffii]